MSTKREYEKQRATYWPFRNPGMSETFPADKWKDKEEQGRKKRQPKKKSNSRWIGLPDNNVIHHQQPKTMPRLIVRYRS